MCQHVDFNNYPLECAVILIGAWVYVFTPFNMTEGRTRYRYAFGYTVELVENCAMFAAVYTMTDDRQQVLVVAMASIFCFLCGILTMMVYYQFCHPTLGDARWSKIIGHWHSSRLKVFSTL
jgi:hypothetical protein